MSKREIPDEIQDRLDEFHVEVPDIPVKRSRLERLANWIYAPAKDPLEMMGVKGNSIAQLAFYPLAILLVLFFAPALFI